ncbi:hypothetical protein OPV22_021390 [Ensete ventricosum]|uniref:Uncharacterized protein n=1 Tax=Ensete ventricosum TaxID=4639 RepID=A0AAV8QL53_ENSVE|nr:hypothetical protein OPV22_021390 [Ensete ventricosum]
MSRCFPFPPPGYEKKTSDHIDLLAEDKHKEKKRKKEKKDKEKKEGKERKDTDRSKDKHKEKDRKEKHKDKKRKNKDENRRLYDRADKQTESPHGDLLGECSRKTEETKTSKFAEKLERKIEDEEKMAANRKAENFSGPVQKSIGNLAAATAMVKERVAGDKIVPPTMGALQRRIDGFERPTDKFTFPTQRKNEALDSANAVQKERSASDKLVPKLASTGQKGNGHTKSPVEYPVGSVHKRFEGPYAATAVEIDNQNSKKVVSSSNSDVPRTINGTGQPAQSFSACKNLNAIGLATKMEDGGRANKILQNHILTEQRRVVGLDQAMARDASNKIEEGKAKSKGRDADDRKEERHRDRVHDEKKIKDKDEHKGKKKEKAKVKEKGEQKDKELKDPRDGRKKDQLDSLDVKTLAPQTDKAESYLTDETLKKRKEIGTNGFSNENNLRPNKFPKRDPSYHLREGSGRTLESSHVGAACSSLKLGAISNVLVEKPIDNKEHKINGKARAQAFSDGSRHPVAADSGATGKAYTIPHPDSVHLDKIYYIPKVDEWPEYDDQEWLFSSCHLLQKPKTALGGDEVPQVWSEVLRIESEDVVALPYVIPF